jgi:hypothetical protein
VKPLAASLDVHAAANETSATAMGIPDIASDRT